MTENLNSPEPPPPQPNVIVKEGVISQKMVLQAMAFLLFAVLSGFAALIYGDFKAVKEKVYQIERNDEQREQDSRQWRAIIKLREYHMDEVHKRGDLHLFNEEPSGGD